MLRSCYRPIERCLGRRSGDGLLWHMDLKPHASGDFSIAVVQANSSLEDQSQVFTSPSATYVGVYDGHGGPEASRFVNRHLFPFLHRNPSLSLSLSLPMNPNISSSLKFVTEHGGLSADVIKKAFSATEEEFLHLVKQSLPVQPNIASVGSCCLVGAISHDALYVANLGDSRAVLGRTVSQGQKREVVAERLSKDHNVACEEVRKEVKALHPDDSTVVINCQGVWRIKGIIQSVVFKRVSLESYLNLVSVLIDSVSRSIGDVYLKKPEFNRDPLFRQFGHLIPLKRPVLTAEPSILIRKLRPEDLFLIFASDGLWEQLSDEEAVEIVLKNPRAGIAKRLVGAALQEAAKKKEIRYNEIRKIEKGTRRHFHDDITVIVMYLDHQKGSTKGRFKQSSIGCTTAPVDIFSNMDETIEEIDDTLPLAKRTQRSLN
ncbi:hypothetical protein RHSIM_Rhsim05G0089600 [Rhododendron simsii]|uniref:protein-serine/threonine phosphatase n=1 Tax=Rhododendron simsii TaxID=118357 RepID=A0A834LM87_RHOSS|nr:hypothetical protein RHSIM_Rhsim05G0089600 [Rhododendron simsii]